jgi:hypothetical protein
VLLLTAREGATVSCWRKRLEYHFVCIQVMKMRDDERSVQIRPRN